MEEFILKKNEKTNAVDNLTDALVNVMKYNDSKIEYPSFNKAKSDDGVLAEWFYSANNGQNDFSELTSIHMYTSQESTFEDIGELMLGIALTEMKHYSKLCDFIKKIGGRIDQKFNNSSVTIGKDSKEAVQIAIKAEEKAIEFYGKIEVKLKKVEETNTVKIALQLISKIVADENVHLDLLKEQKK